ncbi:MAG: ribonuclease P protein component [Thermoanaerobaculia bacterium]|nr:ribonuclease P protein component [Thermoanaerobaculia bacterium]
MTHGDVPERSVEGAGVRQETLSRDARLRQGRDFKRCYRRGRRRVGEHMILYYSPNDLVAARFGTTLSRKVGNSVVRHRIKRRLREIFRRSDLRASLPAVDVVAHVKPAASSASFADLRAELESLMSSIRTGRRHRDAAKTPSR